MAKVNKEGQGVEATPVLTDSVELQSKVSEQSDLIILQENRIEHLEKNIANQGIALDKQEKELAEKEAHVKDLEKIIADQSSALDKQEKTISEQSALLAKQDVLGVVAKEDEVVIRFLLSPAGRFKLPYNVKQEVALHKEVAAEIVEAKYAEYVEQE